jgi:hypothetical protein
MQTSLAGATLALASCLGLAQAKGTIDSSIPATYMPFHSIPSTSSLSWSNIFVLPDAQGNHPSQAAQDTQKCTYSYTADSLSQSNCSNASLFHLQAFCRNQGDTTDNVCARTSRGILAFWWCQVLQHIAEQSVK